MNLGQDKNSSGEGFFYSALFSDFGCTDAVVVVLATQRSGSTLLCERLNQNGLGRGEEHILEFIADETGAVLDKNCIESVFERFDQLRFLEAGVLGETYSTKIMMDYFTMFCGAVNSHTLLFNDFQRFNFFLSLYAGSQFIGISRINKVAQAISRVMAEESGVTHRRSGESQYVTSAKAASADYNGVVIFSFRSIERHIRNIINQERQLLRLVDFLKRNGQSTLWVYYDGSRLGPLDKSESGLLCIGPRCVHLDLPAPTSTSRLSNRYNLLFELLFYRVLRRLGRRRFLDAIFRASLAEKKIYGQQIQNGFTRRWSSLKRTGMFE